MVRFEKYFVPKIILGPQIWFSTDFGTKTNGGSPEKKCWFQKNFASKNLCLKKFLAQKFRSKKSLGPKKILCPTKISGQTNFRSKQILGPKKVCNQKIVGSKKFCVQKILGAKNFGSKKVYGSTKIVGPIKI